MYLHIHISFLSSSSRVNKTSHQLPSLTWQSDITHECVLFKLSFSFAPTFRNVKLPEAISSARSHQTNQISKSIISLSPTDQIRSLTSAAPINIPTTYVRPSDSYIITAPSTNSPPLNQIETFITRTETAILSSHSRSSRNINGPKWSPNHRRPFPWTHFVSNASRRSPNAQITTQLTNLI